MKQVLGILILVALAFGASKKGSTKGYMGWGVGGGISLAVPDDGWSFHNWYDGYYDYYDYYDYNWWGCQGVGPGAELKGVIRFGIGKAGYIHYVPNVTWWGRWEDVNYLYPNWSDYPNRSDDVKLHDHEVNINLSGARYVPPVPRSFPVKPYVGFGLLDFNIYTWRGKSETTNRKNKDTEFQIHQNFFTGAEFELDGNFWPYVEFKLSNGAVDDFQMTAGFTIQGRK